MLQTGLGIPEILSILAILLPVIPVLIIAIRHTWQQETMIFLGAVCLLAFMQHLLLYLPQLLPVNATFINSLFGLSEFVLFFHLFKTVIEPQWVKELFHTILIAYSSVAITIFSLRGTEVHAWALSITAALLLLASAILALLQLIRDKQLFIFQSPLFWIAGGNICYYCIFILTGFVGTRGKGTMAMMQEKMILLSVINDIRFVFFIVAACTVVSSKQPLEKLYN